MQKFLSFMLLLNAISGTIHASEATQEISAQKDVINPVPDWLQSAPQTLRLFLIADPDFVRTFRNFATNLETNNLANQIEDMNEKKESPVAIATCMAQFTVAFFSQQIILEELAITKNNQFKRTANPEELPAIEAFITTQQANVNTQKSELAAGLQKASQDKETEQLVKLFTYTNLE